MDKMDDHNVFHDAFIKHKGHQTIPIMYLNGMYLGNYFDIKMKAYNGELRKALAAVGIATRF